VIVHETKPFPNKVKIGPKNQYFLRDPKDFGRAPAHGAETPGFRESASPGFSITDGIKPDQLSAFSALSAFPSQALGMPD
jgi:hypothetical protein